MRAGGLALITICLCPLIMAAGSKPRVPSGNDPGGVAVGLIGSGVDYTAPGIAARLARDGEGELIGWDFVDDDRRPFHGGETGNTALARVVAREAPSARLAVFRVSREPGITLGRAAAYAAQSPARIVLAPALSGRTEDWEAFRRAAAHFTTRLFIVPAGDAGIDLANNATLQGLAALENVLVVGAANADGQLPSGSNTGASAIAIAVGIGEGAGAVAGASMSEIAAARVAALAARLSVNDEAVAGAALRSKIVELANKQSVHEQTRFGWIANPAEIADGSPLPP